MTAPRPRETRALLTLAGEAQAAAESIVELVTTARANVVEAYEIAREPQVWTAIGRMSVETVKDTVDGRARLDELPAHGIYTVADILRAGPERLIGVPGIGAGTARKALDAAEQLKRAATDSLQFRIDFDPSDRDMTRLLTALAIWGAVRYAAEAYETDAERLRTELARLRPIAEPAGTGRLRRLFMRSADRSVAGDAARRIQDMLDEAESSGLLRAAEEARGVRTPRAELVWRDFEQRSADYYGLLGQVVGLGGDVAASEGYLPADIVERVSAQQLDTSRLNDGLRLRGYQSFGARFALVQRRVVLGDEMGLGKTVQAIAAMAHLAARGATHFLVVCPASVLINWAREVARHSTIPVLTVHGNGRARAAARWRNLGGVGVVTFGALGALDLSESTPAMLVVDEAHYVKNPEAKRSQAVNRVAAQSERVLFLSGTPMENRIDEFRALIAHLRPEIAADMGPEHAAIGVEAFRRAAAPVYLRRNQPDVLTELPELVQVEEWEEFGAEDGAAYRDAVQDGNFMAMRRAAFTVGRPQDSAKLTRLLELAGEAMDNDRKVVVFSYFRDVLTVVCDALGAEARGPITGATPVPDRQRIVDEFTASPKPSVLVCQIEAAGVGVNIQAASVVILCEPQVKPSIEAQAIARAHRMGQVRTVQVHRLLIAESVDERMIEILGSKAQLFDAYARHSTIAQATPGATDVSEVQLARMIVAQEQQRLAGTPQPPRGRVDTASSTQPDRSR